MGGGQSVCYTDGELLGDQDSCSKRMKQEVHSVGVGVGVTEMKETVRHGGAV